ncbi:hypothetical protein [Flavobacterium sp. HNIBRBA15423]|uniref:hypothetical protein n=1 Tax=Flavobacterium sp. HNIBRBA15423 TaxID=3458683 RepID=UPI004044E775
MKLLIEFPMQIVITYHGISNLDETLDENISYLIGKYFYQNNIDFKMLSLNFIASKPNINDKLIRYEIELGVNKSEFQYDWILKELEMEGYEKGLTIKTPENEIIYADEYTADITFRRKLKKYNF